ncbi:MAG: hypothetical protein IKY33_03595 [Clostridia bacterium]|nr:hypothetical protein [Clostridia bacterium]
MAAMEIERKYIVRIPRNLQAFRCAQMVQTYLVSTDGTRRIRQVICDGEKEYYFTHKIRRSDLSCWEDERRIDENEYKTLLLEADPRLQPVKKTRYYYPYEGLTFEIDVYPFWQRQCVMEVELESEAQTVKLPYNIDIVAEVTGDIRYKNVSLARQIPEEMI